VLTKTFVGHDSTGFSSSTTVTVNEHPAWFPDPSVAVQFTVVAPFANLVPEGGLHVTVTPLQSSLADTATTTAREHCPGSVFV